MKRFLIVTVAFLVGCSGGGAASNALLPTAPGLGSGTASRSAAPSPAGQLLPLAPANAHRGKTKVHLTMTIPHRRRGDRAGVRHPATISPLTQSVGVGINGGAAQVFTATPTSPGCSVGASGTTCTFVVDAPLGADTFVISTYSAAGGGGSLLDRGTALFNVVAGKANAPSVTLGPVVSTTSDSGIGSLRYAIGSANPGDTIMFVLPAGSVVTVASPITLTNRVSIAGPGITASARRRGERHASTTYSGVTLSGGSTQQIMVLKAGATATVSGLIFTGGSATTANQPGGAIYNAGALTLTGDAFTANSSSVDSPFAKHAPKRARHKRHGAQPFGLHPHCTGSDTYGGAVYNHGTLSVTSTYFDGNSVASNVGCSYYGYGGAIYNDEYGILTSSGNVYTNNGAYDGGAVYNNSEFGQATFTNDTFSANLGCTATTGCATTGCVPSSHCTTYAEGDGGAIYDADGPGASITGSVFENNAVGDGPTGDGYGGALDLETGSPSVTGSSFTGNLAGGGTSNCSEGLGGAIYLDASGPLQLSNDAFTGNQAGGDFYGDGGAIIAYSAIQGSADTFTSNASLAIGSPCATSPASYGGAIVMESSSGPLNLSGSTFTNNTATSAYASYAGAIWVYSQTRLSGDTFTGNTAIATGVTGVYTYTYGGALYNDGGALTLSGSTFTSNAALSQGAYDYYVEGGAIYNDIAMSSTNDTFTSNVASATGSYSEPYAFGGAVENDSSGSFVSSGDTFKSNSVTALYEGEGGAVYSDGSMTISNASFASNAITNSLYGYGGALATDEAGTVSNSTFTANVNGGSNTYGGAIYDDGGLTLNGSTVSGNSASAGGGGAYLEKDGDAVTNSTISGNAVTNAYAYYGGGGIYGDASIVLTNSTVSGNGVTVTGLYAGGGGIYNDSGLTMSGSTISGNAVHGTIAGSGGGGIFNYDDATIVNSTLTGNFSGVDGGGFETYGNYTVKLINDTLYQNAAAGVGGNIDNPYSLTLANSIAAGGTAATGPDIDNLGTLTSGDYNVIGTPVAGNLLAGTTTHNQTANPVLLALTNNGGPTFTNADTATSPGKADIPFAAMMCNGWANTGVDQRGYTRGSGGRCDVGAFEFAGTPDAARTRPLPVVAGGHHRHAKPAPRAKPPVGRHSAGM